MTQRTLLDEIAEAERLGGSGLAARSDPATSRQAASVVRNGTRRAQVLLIFAANPDGLTDEQATERLGWDYSPYGPRRRELIRDGYLADSGTTRRSSYGMAQIVWIPTERALRWARDLPE